MNDNTNKFERIICPRCDFRIPVRPDLIDYKSAYEDCQDMSKSLSEERQVLLEICRHCKAEIERMRNGLVLIHDFVHAVELSEDDWEPDDVKDMLATIHNIAEEKLKEEE